MKIKELKAILAQIPDSMDEVDIFTTLGVGCCGEFEELENMDVDFRLPDNKPEGHPLKDSGMLRIDFGTSLPGYRSCRQVSETKRLDKEYWLNFPGSRYYKEYKGES